MPKIKESLRSILFYKNDSIPLILAHILNKITTIVEKYPSV